MVEAHKGSNRWDTKSGFTTTLGTQPDSAYPHRAAADAFQGAYSHRSAASALVGLVSLGLSLSIVRASKTFARGTS